jgi:phytoene dehydrogenase-like protein
MYSPFIFFIDFIYKVLSKYIRTLRALVAFAAVQSTYKGPFTPGSALCLVYTFAQNEGGGLMRRVKGGMGMLSEALCRSIADKGGEVRTKTGVRSILVEDGCATGVELRDGTRITARAVLSNLDKPATLFELVGRRLDALFRAAHERHGAAVAQEVSRRRQPDARPAAGDECCLHRFSTAFLVVRTGIGSGARTSSARSLGRSVLVSAPISARRAAA